MYKLPNPLFNVRVGVESKVKDYPTITYLGDDAGERVHGGMLREGVILKKVKDFTPDDALDNNIYQKAL